MVEFFLKLALFILNITIWHMLLMIKNGSIELLELETVWLIREPWMVCISIDYHDLRKTKMTNGTQRNGFKSFQKYFFKLALLSVHNIKFSV